MEVTLILIALFITAFASITLRIVYSIYSHKENSSNKTGKEVAEIILHDNDLDNIKVGEVSGSLSDYYSNSEEVVMLSEGIYSKSSVAAVSVAAHECGHAIQYKEGYYPIKLRNNIVPFVNFGNTLGYIAIMISLASSLTGLFTVGIILISFAVVFQLITLPVEFDASRRGKKELVRLKLIDEDEVSGVRIMLISAAFTYVAGLISSILQILRLIFIFQNRRRD